LFTPDMTVSVYEFSTGEADLDAAPKEEMFYWGPDVPRAVSISGQYAANLMSRRDFASVALLDQITRAGARTQLVMADATLALILVFSPTATSLQADEPYFVLRSIWAIHLPAIQPQTVHWLTNTESVHRPARVGHILAGGPVTFSYTAAKFWSNLRDRAKNYFKPGAVAALASIKASGILYDLDEFKEDSPLRVGLSDARQARLAAGQTLGDLIAAFTYPEANTFSRVVAQPADLRKLGYVPTDVKFEYVVSTAGAGRNIVRAIQKRKSKSNVSANVWRKRDPADTTRILVFDESTFPRFRLDKVFPDGSFNKRRAATFVLEPSKKMDPESAALLAGAPMRIDVEFSVVANTRTPQTLRMGESRFYGGFVPISSSERRKQTGRTEPFVIVWRPDTNAAKRVTLGDITAMWIVYDQLAPEQLSELPEPEVAQQE
jgi:hypothetical protein